MINKVTIDGKDYFMVMLESEEVAIQAVREQEKINSKLSSLEQNDGSLEMKRMKSKIKQEVDSKLTNSAEDSFGDHINEQDLIERAISRRAFMSHHPSGREWKWGEAKKLVRECIEEMRLSGWISVDDGVIELL